MRDLFFLLTERRQMLKARKEMDKENTLTKKQPEAAQSSISGNREFGRNIGNHQSWLNNERELERRCAYGVDHLCAFDIC